MRRIFVEVLEPSANRSEKAFVPEEEGLLRSFGPETNGVGERRNCRRMTCAHRLRFMLILASRSETDL